MLRTCSHAACSGHLAILQWPRGQGCPWDIRMCAKAASGGHLAVLEWARALGCPYDEDLCNEAAENTGTYHEALEAWEIGSITIAH